MSQAARRRKRLDELVSQPLVRRSPRLSNRLSHLAEQDSGHPLYEVSSRATLSGYNRGRSRGSRSNSRSTSPNTILNESGQTVPVAFHDNRPGPSRRDGVPHHLYGLDSDEIEIEFTGSGSEPTRWNVYDKERVVITSPPSLHDNEEDLGYFGRGVQFFTSLLFKLGSFLYLAATAILCLDVIVLHRLFNFSSVSQRSGAISRFFVLLLALCVLIGFLIGGHLFPKYQPTEKVNVSESDLKTVVASITRSLELKMGADLDAFEAKFKRDMDTRISVLINNSITRLSFDQKDQMNAETERQHLALLQLREDLMNEMDDFRNHEASELKASLETKFAEVPGQLDDLKNSVEPQIDDLRESQNELLRTVRLKFDGFSEKQEGLLMNMSTTLLHLDRHNNRISDLEEKLKVVLVELATLKSNYLHRINRTESALNQSLPEHMVVEIFNQELDKSTSDKDSPLRMWLDLVFASKNDLQNIHKLIEELQAQKMNPNAYGTDLTKRDVEEMIAFSLRKFGADRIGKFDFALESSGGSVMLNECSATYAHTLTSVSLLGLIPLWYYMSNPKIIIEPSLYPGNCWAMAGQSGHATLKLRDEVVITGVTLDHIPQELSPNGTLDTTPKDFTVHGFITLDGDPVELGKFTYDLNGPPIQQFDIMMQAASFNFARFAFLSNYGNLNYTCIYRVRVHGHYP